MDNKIYDYISLYSSFILALMPLLVVCHLSVYLAAITLFGFLCIALHCFFKLYGYKAVDFITKTKGLNSVNKRPPNAFNCDSLNKGGDYSNKPGFPSGHTIIATFVCFLILFEFLDKNNTLRQRNRLIPILIIVILGQILVPYARIKKSCHTITQVIGGIVLGILMAIFFKFFERKIFVKSTKYLYEKQKFLNCE